VEVVELFLLIYKKVRGLKLAQMFSLLQNLMIGYENWFFQHKFYTKC